MAKSWRGKTPYDSVVPYTPTNHVRAQGYRAGMNSSEVKAMYNLLLRIYEKGLFGIEGVTAKEIHEQIAVYETGLKENNV